MAALSNKSKQYGLIALKVLILCIAFAYIYAKISRNETLSLAQFLEILSQKSWTPFLLFLGLALANWFFEILKWQTLAATLEKMSFGKALKQSLAAHTVSLATPNRIGEYGAKAYFFEAKKRKRILLLTLFSNINQMLITLLMGIIGLVTLIAWKILTISLLKILLLFGVSLLLVVLGYVFKEKELVLKGLSLSKVIQFFKTLSMTVRIKTLLFSLTRYALFSVLFFLLLNYFNADLDIKTAFPLLFAMYLFVSVIPSFLVLDVLIRGGVAIGLFSLVGVNEIIIVCAVMTSWLFNFVVPALVGSFYVITHKAP